MEQIVELETRFNAIPSGGGVVVQGGDYDDEEVEAIVSAAATEQPLARRVKVLGVFPPFLCCLLSKQVYLIHLAAIKRYLGKNSHLG